MKITRNQLKKIVQEARWEDSPSAYGGAEGDVDHATDMLYETLINAFAEALDAGLTFKEVMDQCRYAKNYIEQMYTPK